MCSHYIIVYLEPVLDSALIPLPLSRAFGRSKTAGRDAGGARLPDASDLQAGSMIPTQPWSKFLRKESYGGLL